MSEDNGPKTNPASPSGHRLRLSEVYRRECHRVAALLEELGRARAQASGSADMETARLANQLRELGKRFFRWAGAEPRSDEERKADTDEMQRLSEEAKALGLRL